MKSTFYKKVVDAHVEDVLQAYTNKKIGFSELMGELKKVETYIKRYDRRNAIQTR